MSLCKSAKGFKVLSPFYIFQDHFYLETQVTIAVPKGEDGEMELFVSTQNPTFTQVSSFIRLFIQSSSPFDMHLYPW